MIHPKTSSLAYALIFAAALAPAPAWAGCSLAVDALGTRIAKANSLKTGSPGENEAPASVKVMNEKLRETTGDLKYGARGHDITRNRLATASETASRETLPPEEAAKSGVRHFQTGTGVVTPENTGPLLQAESYWRQARELNAQGNGELCSQAVARGNAALDRRKN